MSYAYYGSVTIDHTKVGSTDSSNFPVYVSLSDTALKTVANGGKITSSSGYDLAFFSDIGLASALAFEIESYSGTSGNYKAFVKITTLSHTADTVIYFGYGDSSVTTSQENLPSTWVNGFVSVWHFRDGSSLDLTNSVSGGPTLASMGGTAASAGLIGSGAVDIDGTNNHGLYAATAPFSTYPLTLEAWFNADVLSNGKCLIGVGQVPASGAADAEIQLRTTGAIRMNVGGISATTTATVTAGTTHYAAGTASSEDSRTIYLDGANAVTVNTAHSASQGTWGGTYVGDLPISGSTSVFVVDGRIDEVRVSNVVRSADWILATYNNLNSVGTFITNTYGNPVVANNSGDIAAASSFSGPAYWNGSNRMLSIDVCILSNTRTVSSITYGGATCTLVGAQTIGTRRVECWRIHSQDSGAPTAGTNTLIVTLSGSAEFIVAWVNRQRVNVASPTEAFNSASATNSGSADDATVTITTVTNSSTIHAACVSSDISITANQTSRNNVVGTLGSGANEDPGAVTSPAAAVPVSYTGLGTTATWAIAGYGIRPDTAGFTFKGRPNYDIKTLSM